MRTYFFILLLVSILFSCAEATKENSKYKEQISKLDAQWNQVDSTYQVFKEIDHALFLEIANEGKKKYSEARKKYVSDTLVPVYDQALAVFKGNFVKGIKNVSTSKKAIENEYPVAKEQITDLNHDLIHELIPEDSVSAYVTNEINSLSNYQFELSAYNSKAKNALNSYDSMVHELDSIVAIYGKK